MIPILLVLVAHGLDALTFLMAVERWGLWGESAPIAQRIAADVGVTGMVGVKLIGAEFLAAIVMRLRWRVVLLLAAGAGIVGASSNLAALLI